MHAEPVIDEADIVERVALARQTAQQQKAAAVQQFATEARAKYSPSVGSGNVSGVISGKSTFAERVQMR